MPLDSWDVKKTLQTRATSSMEPLCLTCFWTVKMFRALHLCVSALYALFESGQLSGSYDVYEHGIPGGQYTNSIREKTKKGVGAVGSPTQ